MDTHGFRARRVLCSWILTWKIPSSDPLPCAPQTQPMMEQHHTDSPWRHLHFHPATKFKRRRNPRFRQEHPKQEKGNARKHGTPEKKVLGMKTPSNLESRGEGNLEKKRYRSTGEKEMELHGGNWVIGNLTSVYENMPLIFIAQS